MRWKINIISRGRSGARAAVLAPLLAALFWLGCVSTASRREGALRRFEFEEPQMGVPFRMVLYALDEKTATNAANAAFERIARLNSVMSDYETDSEVSRLSRSSEEGSPAVRLSEDLWTVLEAAQRLSTQSEGAFDVTIGPCAALWRKARRERRFPDRARLENARAKVGYTNLVLDAGNRAARLLRFGMRLDLGGIAKGYAADEALEVLRAHGVARALVAASGDLAIGDPPPAEKGWKIEIAGYDSASGPPTVTAMLANVGIATSGDLFQRLEIEGVRYSHILNPFTCVGMTNHALATVIARDCMTADMLATTLTILPPEKGLALAGLYSAGARVIQMRDGRLEPVQNSAFEQALGAR